jgi:hypothetical protein
VLAFTTPADAQNVNQMQITLSNSQGFTLTRTLSRWRSTPFRINLGLAPGAYELQASTKQGHRATRGFRVTEGDAAKTISILLQ